ncbi:hypothetical protein Poli38472_000452 [Pythium oligandrum]|uniref:Uncharacterized protein n=1 Tax=Pythium oligandrum TaxID=41045 RepID=A0A8K1CCR0_PYTOL|nr:hypothetical protein Poli38472_000452 [Pythium oligandrum]|eukprot:TMW60410.1 hypothetical protein Poli38472_000452 [Pythium oligandrum]
MDSDDSAASEVASEAEYEDSFVADEIEESVETVPKSKPTVPPTTTRPEPIPPASRLEDSNAYAEDEYEEDDAYSVDFEDADDEAKPKQAPSPPRRVSSPVRPIAEDTEYYEASFEDESRLSQSLTRHIVDLSVPVRRDSRGSSAGASPLGKASLNANSPNVNLKVLSKPTTAPPPPVAPPPGPGTIPGAWAMPSAATLALLEKESEASLSLLLRKVESKYQDELEELREQNALLTWKERELKTELRIQREELKMRKTRIDKKRKRALERRKENDELIVKLKNEAEELQNRHRTTEERLDLQIRENEQLRATLTEAENERRNVETRNLALAEKLQTTLSDFHALNLKYEDAVQLRLDAEKKVDDLVTQHRMECEVLTHKARVDVEAMQKTLQDERDARVAERKTLPDSHRAVVDAERERLERLETQLTQQVRTMEAQLARDTVRFEKELALAWEAKRVAEERAEKRLHEELTKITRERDALDEQRRELLLSVTKTSTRFDEERGKLDLTREQLEVKRLKLVEERAELDARAAYLEDRVHRLAQEESVLEARKGELTKLGRETFEKSRMLAQKMASMNDLRAEVERLRAQQVELQSRAKENALQSQQMQMERAALEKTQLQLQHERLLVAKQRAQSRQVLDGTKKLEQLLVQHKALEQVAGRKTTPGSGSIPIKTS